MLYLRVADFIIFFFSRFIRNNHEMNDETKFKLIMSLLKWISQKNVGAHARTHPLMNIKLWELLSTAAQNKNEKLKEFQWTIQSNNDIIKWQIKEQKHFFRLKVFHGVQSLNFTEMLLCHSIAFLWCANDFYGDKTNRPNRFLAGMD